MNKITHTLEHAELLDRQDPLAEFRSRFSIADPDLLYVDGNSLGRMPLAAVEFSEEVINHQWGERLIRGWGEGWLSAPQRVGAKIAKLIGASADEVIIADSTSINLFKMAVAALRFQPNRRFILTDDLNFPSDLYVLQSIVDLLGEDYAVKVIASEDGINGPEGKLINNISQDTALLTLSHVVFKSGFLYDIEKITDAAQKMGAITLWDLSHSAGVVPIKLNASGVDLAVGCCYKYLNGGPGAPAFIYVRRDLQKHLFNPIAGWMGTQKMFDFSLEYTPSGGMRRFLTGTPSVIGLSMIEPGLDILIEAGIEEIRKKSEAQIDYLGELVTNKLGKLGFKLKSPPELMKRGSHISLSHPEGLRINKALIEQMNVIPDFRLPDNIRIGVAPLYTRYQDLFRVIERIEHVVENGIYLEYSAELPEVT